MINRPTNNRLTEAKRNLTLSASEKQYHDVWALIHEIEALQKEKEELRSVRRY